jgi:hypothetical protein
MLHKKTARDSSLPPPRAYFQHSHSGEHIMQDKEERKPAANVEPEETEDNCAGEPEFSRPKLEIVHDADGTVSEPTVEEAEDEEEYRKMRRDLPGATGASAAGIIAIMTSKMPAGRNEFFRTLPSFSPVIDLVDTEVGMERQYFTATDEMKTALAGIGITMSPYTLYLTKSETGAVRVVPIRCMDDDGNQNEYSRTKEVGIIRGRKEWVRVYPDLMNKMYKVFPAPKGRFSEPVWPKQSHARIFRLAFRDKGHHIDSPQHPLFMKWAGRAADKK